MMLSVRHIYRCIAIIHMPIMGLCLTAPAAAEDLPALVVEGKPMDINTSIVEPGASPTGVADSASLMQRVPGGAYNDNGPVSGQTQYRGMYGPRMNVRIDGMYIDSGGPNWMDPPLHYMPTTLLESLEVQRGIAPVSSGGGIGGYVEADMVSSEFTNSRDFDFQSHMALRGHSVDDGFNAGGLFGVANNRHRLHFFGARDEGDDTEFGGGTIAASEYERDTVGLGYGFQLNDNHEFGFKFQHTDTGDSGNPTLPLDIAFFNTNLYQGKYNGSWGNYEVEASISHSHINHKMTNFRLRPTPDFTSLPAPFAAGDDKRFVRADSEGTGYSITLSRSLYRGTLSFGLDGHLGNHDATVGDPDFTKFFVTNFNNAGTDRFGIFGEWSGLISQNMTLDLGLRYNHVRTDADAVDALPARLADDGKGGMPATNVQTLRDDFNNSDRDKTDHNIDIVTKLTYSLAPQLDVELGFGRKTRSPGYQERYLWIPLEVNSGLGDGNNYVGNPELDPEVNHEVELGFDIGDKDFRLTPRFFYRRVDDYIQGVEASQSEVRMVSDGANGDATPLRFANVDAEFFGSDAELAWRFLPGWRVDAVLSYVRGKRRDIDDDLFRIAPLNGRLAITRASNNWSLTAETVAFARQDNISDTITDDPGNPNNSNDEVPGYALINLYGSYQVPQWNLRFNAGIENLFDRDYQNPTAGFNRIMDSDVAVGQRLPGPGRNIYASLQMTF